MAQPELQKQGEKLFQLYTSNVGGLNISDSAFTIKDDQATDGYNYEYSLTGGIIKSLCPARLNDVADAQLRTLGTALYAPKNGSKTIMRMAGTKVQITDLAGNFTNLTEDTTAATSNFLAVGTQKQVVHRMFVTPSTDVLWMAGGGMDTLHGAVSTSKVTENGVVAPTGALSVSEIPSSDGQFLTIGDYYYGVSFHKLSTGAESNIALDVKATLTNVLNNIQISLSGLTNVDATKYDKIYIYRSAVGGFSGFTTGDLVATIPASSTTYTDKGTELAQTQNVARAGNVVLDNSQLPAGTYETLSVFKRRLVTSQGSTLYFSDINKPESWPLTNNITLPTGGPITGLATISFTPNAASTDEFLAVFKENEVWVVSGDNYEDWVLKFVDNTGCVAQPLIAVANGYLYFIDSRGVHMWDGMNKPIYISRPLEPLFGADGKIDQAKFYMGSGQFFKRQNQVIWFLSHNTIGEQQFVLKLDLRLTLPQIESYLGVRMIDGVFLQGKVADPVYASSVFIFPTASNQEEVLITGDNIGYLYRQFYATEGVGPSDYDFTYVTKNLDMGRPGQAKQFYQVVAWVDNLGNWPLQLDYWTEWKGAENNKNVSSVVINPNTDGTLALWDIGQWDVAKWDDYQSNPKKIVFNLAAAPYNNNQGEVIKLRFKNSNANQPIQIHGFGVYFGLLGNRT